MINHFVRCWRVCAAVMVLAVISCQILLAAETTVRKPAVLVLSGANSIDFPLLRSFHLREGYQFNYMGSQEVLTWDHLKKYNAVVVLDPYFSTKVKAESLFTLLDKFMEEGGGVLFTSGVEDTGSMCDSEPAVSEFTKLLMERFGISYLRQQALREKNDDAALRFGFFNEQVFYTENITAHPVTQEVKGIWYPAVARDVKWNAGTRGMPSYALYAPEPWQVLVSGSKTAYTTVEDVRFQNIACPEIGRAHV